MNTETTKARVSVLLIVRYIMLFRTLYLSSKSIKLLYLFLLERATAFWSMKVSG